MALGDEEVAQLDLEPARRFCAGSQLPAEVAEQANGLFGDVVYNLYGSTEVPGDARHAAGYPRGPDLVGKPRSASRSRSSTSTAAGAPHGETGPDLRRPDSPFEGYTGGGARSHRRPDVDRRRRHFDCGGRLYIDGRDDEMIVSGGENVFPREVEELLVSPPGDRRRRRDRRRGRGLRPAPAGLRRFRAAGGRSRSRDVQASSRTTWPATRSRATSSSSTSSRATRPASPQAGTGRPDDFSSGPSSRSSHPRHAQGRRAPQQASPRHASMPSFAATPAITSAAIGSAHARPEHGVHHQADQQHAQQVGAQQRLFGIGDHRPRSELTAGATLCVRQHRHDDQAHRRETRCRW